MRNLLTILLLAVSASAGAAPAAPACGPTDMSLGMLSNFGTTQRYAEACGVPQSAIERELTSSVKLLRACLEARGIPAAKLDQTWQNGAKLGEQLLPTAMQDPAFCPRVKGGFGKAG
ncbi:hypothetical protein [Pseudoduganella sp. OTU4001]|uniref:hypothetical protein n=1 Tax=Pseudoduganella sp. OTU4001 TaxID=3043854 RepID=UPI00313F3AEC